MALITALLLLPNWNDAAPEMDEGLLVAFPEFVSDGLVPAQDFETFYGPGQPYLLAGAGAIFGYSLELERASGLLFQIGIALSIFVIVLPLGRWIALAAAVASSLVLLGLGLEGVASMGGTAALLAGMALLLLGERHSSVATAALAGVAGAAAYAFRPELVLPVLLSAAPLLLFRGPAGPPGHRLRTYLIALVIASIPFAIWLATLGVDGVSDLLRDLNSTVPNRRLPIPSPTTVDGGLLVATFVIAALAAVGAFVHIRRDRFAFTGRLLLSIALLLFALLPSALQRADSAHIPPVAAIAVGLSALVLWHLLELRPARPAAFALAACTLVAGIGFMHAAGSGLRSQLNSVPDGGYEVVHGDRSFPISSEAAAQSISTLLAETDEFTEPGDRIFVGPKDLTRTFYSDTFIYHLVPDLVPASRYVQLNPGSANGSHSTLASDLEQADVLILTSRHEPDTEDAAKPGSTDAQEVVEDRFCPLDHAGSYSLLVPCAETSGSQPGDS